MAGALDYTQDPFPDMPVVPYVLIRLDVGLAYHERTSAWGLTMRSAGTGAAMRARMTPHAPFELLSPTADLYTGLLHSWLLEYLGPPHE